MIQQKRVAFLPFARISHNYLIPKPYDFIPTTIGEHILKRRLELGHYQKDVANQLGVNPWRFIKREKRSK